MSTSLFDINVLTNTIYLDSRRFGEASLTVTNISGRQIYGRVQATSSGIPTDALTVLDGERFFDVDEAHQFTVQVRLRDTLPGGQYNFYVETLEIQAPDETLQRGPQISFAVVTAPTNNLGLGILLVVLALILIGGIIGATLLITQNTSQGTLTTRIAFSAVSGGNDEIYILNPDTGELTDLTNNPANDRYPAWDQLGTRLAFSSDRSPDHVWRIYIADVDQGITDLLDEAITNTQEIAWRPDGTRIAYVSQTTPQLYVLFQAQDNGDNPEILAQSSVPITSLSYINNEFLSYISANRVHTLAIRRKQEVSMPDLNNTIGIPVTARWSPGHNALAVAAIPPDDSAHGGSSIFTINFMQATDGSLTIIENGIVRLTTGQDDRNPSWSADGTHILFTSTTRSAGYLPQLFSVNVGSAPTVTPIALTNALGVFQPAWQPADVVIPPTPTFTPSPTPTFTPTPPVTATPTRVR